MNFKKIYEIYKATNLNNFVLNCLASSNKSEQQFAIDELRKANLKNEHDVLTYIACHI